MYDFERDVLRDPTQATELASLGGGGYDWNLLEVWRRESDGAIFFYEDAGCSCNGPYEDTRSWDDLVHITSIQPLLSIAQSIYDVTSMERMRFLADVSKHLPL